ncbi:TIGR01777 family oxidoreductase [Amycolatopsis sp. NPDC004368]
MRVLIAGSGGLIGTALTTRLRTTGHDVHRLVRREAKAADEHTWDPPSAKIDEGAFDGIDAVVNLCGAPLLPGRWSAMRKQQLLDSRVEPTEVLAEAVAEHGIPTLVNGSAVGYYGNTGSAVVDETADTGKGFLAELCTEWEGATAPAAKAGARVVLVRTGLVLARQGGLLDVLRPLFTFALGGRLGDGRQFMPWIALDDEVGGIVHALEHETLHGPVNLCGPAPVTNAEFTKALGHAVHRPAPWWVPGFALKLALGEAGEEMALYGQRALPRRLEHTGYEFRHRTLESALAAAT